MIRTPFNTGWAFRPKANEFAEMAGGAVPLVPITLPHDAAIGTTRDPEVPNGAATGYFPSGTWEYTKTFAVPEEWAGKRVVLDFEGVYRSSQVYVNGALAGGWANGYTGFSVPLNDYLVFGGDNTVQVECRTHRDSRWYSGAGIHRPVHLVVGNPVHIPLDGVLVTTTAIDEGFATILVDTELVNSGDRRVTVQASIEVTGPDGQTIAAAEVPATLAIGESTSIRQRLLIHHPAVWDLEHPLLHEVRIVLKDGDEVLDEARERFGIRDLQVDVARGLQLNGRGITLRGACVHHDNGVIGAAAIGRAEHRRVELLKDAGFNAIRSSHNPLSRAMLDACDELGVLVMDEAFDQWTRGKNDFDYALDFETWWERDVEALVRKDRNHPSVFAYSTGNEIPEVATPHGSRLARILANRVRALDPTRFVTNAVNGQLAVMSEWVAQAMAQAADNPGAFEGMGINTMMTQMGEFGNMIGASQLATDRTAEAFATLDIAGMNYTEARYELDRELFPNRVIVGAETFSTQIDRLWALVQNNPHVIGDFTWTGWDYLGEAGIGRTRYADLDDGGVNANYPWLLAHVGDIDITGHRRPASYYREIVFGLRSTPYVAVRRPENHDREVVSTPWAWSDSLSSWSWPGFEGRPITVEVYSDAEFVELQIGGETIGRSEVGPRNRFRAIFETTYQPGELTAIAYRNGRETGRHRLRSAEGSVRISLTVDRTEIGTDDNELAFVDIALVDEEGTVHTGVDQEVELTLAGPAVLQGFGTANPVDEHTDFTDTRHRTFDGRGLAVIRPTGPGTITVTVVAGDAANTVTLTAH